MSEGSIKGIRIAIVISGSSSGVLLKKMHLESWSFKYSQSFVEGPGISMTLLQKESEAPCTFGHSFGFYGHKVWVDKGCRGWFMVKYKRPATGTVNMLVKY